MSLVNHLEQYFLRCALILFTHNCHSFFFSCATAYISKTFICIKREAWSFKHLFPLPPLTVQKRMSSLLGYNSFNTCTAKLYLLSGYFCCRFCKHSSLGKWDGGRCGMHDILTVGSWNGSCGSGGICGNCWSGGRPNSEGFIKAGSSRNCCC